MANDLDPAIEELFSKGIQANLHALLVGTQVSGKMAQAELDAGGDTWHNPYIKRGIAQTYTRQTAITRQDHDAVDESLVVNQAKVYHFYVDDLDMKQLRKNKAVVKHLMQEAAFQLNREIDSDFFAEYSNARTKWGAAGFTTSATINPKTLGAGDVVGAYSDIHAQLLQTIGQKNSYFTVVDPFTAATIQKGAVNGNTFNLADSTYKNGYAGNILGFELFVSTNLTTEVSLGLATNPIAGDTFTVSGVVWTFRAVPSVAGEIYIAANAAATVDIMVNAMNGSATGQDSATGYFEVSIADRNKLNGITTVDGTTSMDLTGNRGKITVSETLTDGTDVWGTQTSHTIAGEKGSIELAVQQEVNMDTRRPDLLLGTDFQPWILYGLKTFEEGKDRFIDVQIAI